MLSVGIIGYRGMVGSVLINRMIEEGDLNKIDPIIFSTSNVGDKNPVPNSKNINLLDAYDINELKKLDCILTTQGSDYTNQVLPKLRDNGYQGYFIDASSALRMQDDTIIVLDPVNREQINSALENGIKNFAGGNCSITLSLLGLNGLLKEKLIDWISIMTYQAASGAGAKNIRQLLDQMGVIYEKNSLLINDKNTSILDIMHNVNNTIRKQDFPINEFGAPLAGSLIPWIDADLNNGNSKEEWKGEVEANKILGLNLGTIKVDGLCVRVGVIRSHSAAITIKLNKNLSINQIEEMIKNNEWVNYVANNKLESLKYLNPIATSESLKIAVGRLKKSNLGENIYNIFTVGDQLLWGAAEPVRRMLNILIEYHKK